MIAMLRMSVRRDAVAAGWTAGAEDMLGSPAEPAPVGGTLGGTRSIQEARGIA
jgi:hypothetical protein